MAKFNVVQKRRRALIAEKKIGPGVSNITTVEEAERVLTAGSKVVLGFLNSLVVSFQILFAS